MIRHKLPLIIFLILTLFIIGGCSQPDKTEAPVTSEEPVVLDEGSVSKDPEYIVDDTGRVIYTDTRETVEGEVIEERDSSLPPVFPGSQRIYPEGEDSKTRESYITRASIETIERFYRAYLERGVLNPDEETVGEESMVNVITSTDPDGRRQTALFVNYANIPEDDPQPDPRAGMKVLLKEFPAQHAVQIVLTTLEETPLGLNPVGTWVTPEEAKRLAAEAEAREAELEARRREAENAVENPEDE